MEYRHIFGYYDIGHISIGEEGSNVRVDLPSAPCLCTDARKSLMEERIAQVSTPSEELGRVQKILFHALERTFKDGHFSGYPGEPYVILSPLADIYKASFGRMDRIRQYAGQTSFRKVRVIESDVPSPAFFAEMDSGMLCMKIAKGTDIIRVQEYVQPFVGHEECALWIATFADRISRGEH
ncbi:MAG TPA: hypothetical protein HA362_07720 [Nanoarchaeota archaeon]|nr:hypothetical protein [Nanoarchaeota archaeon]